MINFINWEFHTYTITEIYSKMKALLARLLMIILKIDPRPHFFVVNAGAQ